MNKSQVRRTHIWGRFYLETKSWYHDLSACSKEKAKRVRVFSKPKQLSCKIVFIYTSFLFVQLYSNLWPPVTLAPYLIPDNILVLFQKLKKTNKKKKHIYICNEGTNNYFHFQLICWLLVEMSGNNPSWHPQIAFFVLSTVQNTIHWLLCFFLKFLFLFLFYDVFPSF